MLILNEGDNPHLRLALGALKWIYLINALNAGGPSTLTLLDVEETNGFHKYLAIRATAIMPGIKYKRLFKISLISPDIQPNQASSLLSQNQ